MQNVFEAWWDCEECHFATRGYRRAKHHQEMWGHRLSVSESFPTGGSIND